MKATKKQCLILEFTELPKPIKEVVKGWLGFHNDCLLKISSEFDAEALRKGMSEVEAYWKDMKDRNGYKGELASFIKDYGLAFEIWFIEQNFDLTGVEEVLVNICW